MRKRISLYAWLIIAKKKKLSYSSVHFLLSSSVYCFFNRITKTWHFLCWKQRSAWPLFSPIPFGHSKAAICLFCGGCGRSLDVEWASGQTVAYRDGRLQTSLSCQLTPFPRVPQSKRPSESIYANTQAGEAGKMFRITPGCHTLAVKKPLDI